MFKQFSHILEITLRINAVLISFAYIRKRSFRCIRWNILCSHRLKTSEARCAIITNRSLVQFSSCCGQDFDVLSLLKISRVVNYPDRRTYNRNSLAGLIYLSRSRRLLRTIHIYKTLPCPTHETRLIFQEGSRWHSRNKSIRKHHEET